MLLLVAPLITYILCSRNIHNVKTKNIKVKKRIVRLLMFDINNILSFILLIALMTLTVFGTPLVLGYPLIYFILFALFVVSNAYRYYKYNLKYQLIFNERLVSFRAPFTYKLLKSLICRIIYKKSNNAISNLANKRDDLEKFNIENIKLIILKTLYLPIAITRIILETLYQLIFISKIIIRILYLPIIILTIKYLFHKV